MTDVTEQIAAPDEAVLWTDGACSGNPGPGGWAAIIVAPTGETTELSGGAAETTNNRMEYTAAIEGLRALDPGTAVCIVTDSRLMIDSMTKWLGGWKRKGWRTSAGKAVKNRDLIEALEGELARHRRVRWHWVKGHTTDAQTALNDRADELAVAAAAQASR